MGLTIYYALYADKGTYKSKEVMLLTTWKSSKTLKSALLKKVV